MDKVDVIKIDVEGAEYDVITDICQSEILPQQILIEFHHRFPNVGLGKTRNAIERIRKMGYKVDATDLLGVTDYVRHDSSKLNEAIIRLIETHRVIKR